MSSCFIPFTTSISKEIIPQKLNNPFEVTVPNICIIAVNELQNYLLKNQTEWLHNFGLSTIKTTPVKGKMFGVLVVKTVNNEIGYLCTFSGKLEDEPHPKIFVPSLFDITTNDYFITKGMIKLSKIGNEIKQLESNREVDSNFKIEALKKERKTKSTNLQQQLFDQYHFLNSSRNSKSLCNIFKNYNDKNPAAGSGECAAPKLLQYAFEHQMKPLAITEFWWGKSSKSNQKTHKKHYPACEDKCRPILSYMLSK